MIGIDTNLLLRLVLNDHPEQAGAARTALAAALSRGEDIVIGAVALVETVWTLQKLMRPGRAELTELILNLIATPPLRPFDDAVVGEALRLFSAGSACFSDCLIRAMDQASGCATTLTFDRNALKLPGFAHP